MGGMPSDDDIPPLMELPSDDDDGPPIIIPRALPTRHVEPKDHVFETPIRSSSAASSSPNDPEIHVFETLPD
jgi:hypothetical protein